MRFIESAGLASVIKHHITDVTDCLSRVQAFRTNRHTVHDAFAAEQRERVVKTSQTLLSCCITRIDNKAVCIQQCRRAQEFIRIPPE